MATATTSNTVREAIAGGNAHFMTAFGRGDAAGVAACYTSDAQLLPQHHDALAGRTAIEIYWRGVVELGLVRVRLDTVEIYGEGEFATEVGRYTFHDRDGAEADHGKYLVVWRREAGHYLLHRDIRTTNLPRA